MKKLFALVLTIFLFAQLLLPVYAAGTDDAKVEIKAAYWNKDMLYTFAQVSPSELANSEAILIVNNQQVCEASFSKLSDTDAVVHYMLLVDTSDSMAWYRGEILTFAQKLMESGQKTKMTIAKFDRDFSLVGAKLTHWEEVKTSLESLTFEKIGSDINGSAASAIEYLGAKEYESGELVNLVVITDGEPWYSNDGNLEEKHETEVNQKLSALMETYPEILVHTLSFAEWKENAYAPYSGNNGLHFVKRPAEEAAGAMIDLMDSLYGVFMPLEGYADDPWIQDDIMLLVGMNFVSYSNVRNVRIVPTVHVDASQEHIPEETLAPSEPAVPDATEETSPEPTAEPTEPSESKPEEPSESEPEETTESEPAETTESEPVETGESVPAETTGSEVVITPEPTEDSTVLVWVAVGITVLLAAGFFGLTAAKKRKIRNNSVRMRINVLSGGNIRVKESYYLYDKIQIGTEKKCDIVIPSDNGTVSFRIYKLDQMIYIEDMETADGILLNGMRLFTPNRLRSGDEITAGNVVLQVLF